MKTALNKQNVSRETLLQARGLYGDCFESMEKYIDELLWWNQKVNLVSRDVSRETLQEHVVHSLLPSVMGLLNGFELWVDTGTGGGLPGIPLAIAEPGRKWILNDIVSKKIAAVKQIIHKLELINASGEAGSLEDLELDPGGGIITKHAFAADKLMQMIRDKTWEKIIMYKGVSEAEEEVGSIHKSYTYTLYQFDFGEDEAFFEGKGLLVIEP